MARLHVSTVSASSVRGDTPASSSSRRTRRPSDTPPSPALSASSDKERRQRSKAYDESDKRRSGSTIRSSPSAAGPSSSNKRKRVVDRRQPPATQASQYEHGDRIDKQYYDPDQDEDERRAIKRRMRENEKEFNDNRADYLKAESDGIRRTLRNADEIFREVKQTSDATIDSRLLVGVADLSKKKITELALGDSAIGVDVDELISKCILFMRRGADARREREGSIAPPATQTQNQRRRARRRDDQDEEETGDALDWDYLAKNACFLHNARPCLTGFLLGPLSVQKKVRQQTQRRAREARANPAQALRPMQIGDEDVEKQESANLTETCKEIESLLRKVQSRAEKVIKQEFEKDSEVLEDEDRMQNLLRSNGLADDLQIPLFNFCVNPKSFGQTVENLFYVSFLIKEGSAGLSFDTRGLPTLGPANKEKTLREKQETPRNQAVFTIDFDTFEDIVESYGIKESIIPHREEEEYDDGTGEGRTGWY